MARRDGSGPMGQGPMTGRAMGYCAGEVARRRVYNRGADFAGGLGYGRGAGRGIRRRNFSCRTGFGGYYVDEPVNTMSDKEWLKEEKSLLENRLNLIEEELDNLSDE